MKKGKALYSQTGLRYSKNTGGGTCNEMNTEIKTIMEEYTMFFLCSSSRGWRKVASSQNQSEESKKEKTRVSDRDQMKYRAAIIISEK